jgi:hypothetical protein
VRHHVYGLINCHGDQGPIFRTFFSAENYFPRKIPGNFLEKRFFKTFSAENSIFSQHFLGGTFSAEFSLKFSPEKNVRKIGPWWFCEQAVQIEAHPFLLRLMRNFYRSKNLSPPQKNMAYSCNFQKLPWAYIQSPNGSRKFAQSGRPVNYHNKFAQSGRPVNYHNKLLHNTAIPKAKVGRELGMA